MTAMYRPRGWVRAFGTVWASLAIAGCASDRALEHGFVPSPIRSWHVGVVFVGQPDIEWPLRLKPGLPGDAIPWAEGLALSLSWVPGWILGAPLWGPGMHAAEYAACREAANAAPERIPERFAQLARWPVAETITERLALRVSGREDDRVVIDAMPPIGTQASAEADAVALASSRGAQALIAVELRAIELRRTGSSGCNVELCIDGRVRVRHVADGTAFPMPPLNLQVCRNQASIPLERFLRDEDAFHLALEVGADCIAREINDWIDRSPR